MSSQLLDTQLAFDSVAGEYDGPSGNNDLVQRMRARTMAAVTANIPAGSQLMDLGCGTGLDAEYLARLGYKVVAIDLSAEMAKRTRERIERAGLAGSVAVQQLGIHEIDRLPFASFAGAYSDLGPLNCVDNLAQVAQKLNRMLAPGGRLIASVIGRVCPWEILLFGIKGDRARALLRFQDQLVAAPLNGRTVWTRYYGPQQFMRAFASSGFHFVSLRTLGLLTPPPYMAAFAERHPRWINGLQRMEDRIASLPVLREWGDHFLIVMQKT
jgi:SAM-dependent methyltransferase